MTSPCSAGIRRKAKAKTLVQNLRTQLGRSSTAVSGGARPLSRASTRMPPTGAPTFQPWAPPRAAASTAARWLAISAAAASAAVTRVPFWSSRQAGRISAAYRKVSTRSLRYTRHTFFWSSVCGDQRR